MMAGFPNKDNNFWGFCEGSWYIREDHAKKGLKLFWYGMGKDDPGLTRAQQTVAVLKKHGFDVQYSETEGAHTWMVWREYLQAFAPLLFKQ